MTEPTDALLPCPFCGGAASLHNDTDSPCWFFGCSNSACPIEPCHYADTEAEAIATWNRRTPQPTQPQAGAMPLTDKQINGLIDEGVFFGNCKEIVRAIEAAHGIGIKGGQDRAPWEEALPWSF